jgi:hypothetical protein
MADNEDLGSFLAEFENVGLEPPAAPVAPTVPTKPDLGLRDYILGLSRSYLAGPTFNLAEEAEAGLVSAARGTPYEAELGRIRQERARFAEAAPVTSLGTELLSGLILNPLQKLSMIGRGEQATRLGQTVAAAPGAKLTQAVVGAAPTQAIVAGFGAGEGGVQERLTAGALTGAVGTLGSAASSVAGKIFSDVATEADRLRLSSFGLRPSDITRNIKEMAAKGKKVKTKQEISLVKSLKDFEKRGIVDTESDLIQNAANLEVLREELGGRLGNVINEADVKADVFPDFMSENSQKYLAKLSGEAKEQAANRIKAEREAIIRQFENGGSIEDLQRAKIGLNYTWDDSPLTATVQKAIREDLKDEIENRVAILVNKKKLKPDVLENLKAINKEYGEAVDLRNGFLKRGGQVYGGDVIEDFFAQIRTSGGAGTPLQLAAQTGNIVPAMIGTGASLARTRRAKGELARVMEDPLVQALSAQIGARLPEVVTGRTAAQAVTPMLPRKEVDVEAINRRAQIKQLLAALGE